MYFNFQDMGIATDRGRGYFYLKTALSQSDVWNICEFTY